MIQQHGKYLKNTYSSSWSCWLVFYYQYQRSIPRMRRALKARKKSCLFDCDNLKDLRARLSDARDWGKEEYDPKKHHDLDWIKHTIHLYIKTL
ncbi:hypothetical protein CLU79DRAFT_780093 [Phycomyces nitens]|nr:hypothetical protein CLU79DRAFT_780093 [Phycomyces nitens]